MKKVFACAITVLFVQGCGSASESEPNTSTVNPNPNATPVNNPPVGTPPGNTSSSSSVSNEPDPEPSVINFSVGSNTGGRIVLNQQANCDANCSYNVTQGQVINFAAIADTGYEFSRWQQGCSGTQTTCRLAPKANQMIEASFEPTQTSGQAYSVESFTLINADTDQPIPEHDPIISGASINITALNGAKLNLRANTSQDVQSVRFTHNGNIIRTENRAPYAIASDDSNGNYNVWDIGLGEHTVQGEGFSQDFAAGQAGAPLVTTFTLMAIRVNANTTALNFDAVIGKNQPIVRKFSVTNSGNTAGDFALTLDANWLSVSPQRGNLDPNESIEITATAQSCSQVLDRNGAITLSSNNLLAGTITAEQLCLDDTGSSYDLSFERAYFMQSTTQQDTSQSKENQTPLIADRSALLRVFVIANNNERQPLPRVSFNYQLANGTTNSIELTAPSQLSTKINEAELNATFNAQIPANVLQTGMQYFISIDDGNAINELNERNNRYPATGYATLDIKKMPKFNITFVPISINGEAPQLNAQNTLELLQESLAIHPIADYNIDIRAPYSYNGRSWSNLVDEIGRLRRNEGSESFYHGIVRRSIDGSNTAGIGFISGKGAVSIPDGETIAHELGHNFGRPHAPCGGVSSYDSAFPYNNARIGVWGYDQRSGQLRSPTQADYMSYCGPTWTSDFNYNNVVYALFNNTIRFKTGFGGQGFDDSGFEKTGQIWHIEGSLVSEALTVRTLWHTKDDTLTSNPGLYWAKLLDESDRVLGQASFGLQALDHSTDKLFYATVLNEVPSEAVRKVVIGIGDKTLYEQAIQAPSFSGVLSQKVTQGISLERLDAERIQIRWPTQKGVLAVRSASGQLLGRDTQGAIIIYTRDNTVELQFKSPQGVNTALYDVQ